MAARKAAVASRRDDLVRAREVLWLALDGDRKLQRGVSKAGEPVVFDEPAAGLVRELRAVIRELDEFAVGDGEVATVDDIATRRAARLAGADDSASAGRRSQPRRRGRSDRAG